MYKYNIETLKNGLKLIRIPNKETNLILLQIQMKLGHDLETKKILECGHFIEHLFSTFTSSKYPDGKKNIEDMAFKNIILEHLQSRHHASFKELLAPFLIFLFRFLVRSHRLA